MQLLVAVVNYRIGDLAVEALRALAPEVAALPGTKVVVVDNDSGDDSCEVIAQAIAAEGWGDWAELRPSDHNGGFSYGNNLVIRPAMESGAPPDLFVLINPDTRVRPGALQRLAAFAEAHPRAGLIGCRIVDEQGEVDRSAFRFPTLVSEAMAGVRLGLLWSMFPDRVVAPEPRDEAHRTDWVSGAAMAIRREVVEQIGLMDEGYFLYYEELDFALRAHRAGWECWHEPASEVVHLVGRSTQMAGEGRLERRRPPYWYASRQRYFEKNFGKAYALAATLLYASSLALWKLRRLVERKPRQDPPGLLRDLIRFNLLPGGGDRGGSPS